MIQIHQEALKGNIHMAMRNSSASSSTGSTRR